MCYEQLLDTLKDRQSETRTHIASLKRDAQESLKLAQGVGKVKEAVGKALNSRSAKAAVVKPAAKPAATKAPAKPAASKPEAKAETKPGDDPLGDLAVAKAAAKGNLDPFDYFVQAGAFRTQADADAQRAKLAILGWEARVSEREQNGRAVFRGRVGPFTKRDVAEQLKEKLDGAGLESALVRVQR